MLFTPECAVMAQHQGFKQFCRRCKSKMRRIDDGPKCGINPKLIAYRCIKCGYVEILDKEAPQPIAPGER
jgi:hypothetical protein